MLNEPERATWGKAAHGAKARTKQACTVAGGGVMVGCREGERQTRRTTRIRVGVPCQPLVRVGLLAGYGDFCEGEGFEEALTKPR